MNAPVLCADNAGVEHVSSEAHRALGLMVDVRVVLGAVVPIVVCTLVPVRAKLALGFSAAKPVEAQVP